MKQVCKSFTTILLFVAITACSRQFDYHVSRSIFIPDKEYPGLPVYSEKGYNSFGVYWGLTPFTSEFTEEPSKLIVRGDSCHIYFYGKVNGADRTMLFSIPDVKPDSFSDLISLDGREFDLLGDECALLLLAHSDTLSVDILEGNFTIKRAQNLYVDNVLTQVVLSGIFSFKAIVEDEPASFLTGRFDMGYGDENFFYLQEKE